MLYLRNQRPSRVTRGSSSSLKTGPLIWLYASNSCRRFSASEYIDRNLYMRNGRPCLPHRICANIARPGEVALMATAAAINNGESRRFQESLLQREMVEPLEIQKQRSEGHDDHDYPQVRLERLDHCDT